MCGYEATLSGPFGSTSRRKVKEALGSFAGRQSASDLQSDLRHRHGVHIYGTETRGEGGTNCPRRARDRTVQAMAWKTQQVDVGQLHLFSKARPLKHGGSINAHRPEEAELNRRKARFPARSSERSHVLSQSILGRRYSVRGKVLSWILPLALALSAACTEGTPTSLPDAPRDPTPANRSDSVTAGSSITVESLKLSFRLPDSFREFEDPDLLFLARSDDPPAIFSIDSDTPDIVKHKPEAGESVSPVEIGRGDALVVSHASLTGLPPGVLANELLVANGSRSFTVILSAEAESLAALWDIFIASVRVDGS